MVSYPLAGLIHVFAPENAASEMLIGLYGRVDVDAQGLVSGEGVLVYDWMTACEWEPPQPEDTPAPYCRIDGVGDARFTIYGAVTDYVHRHDDDNPLKEGVFALTDAMSSERLDYAPLGMEITLTMNGSLREDLAFWGFSQPGIQYHPTEAATLGVLVSGLFGNPFEIAPIAMAPVEATPQGDAIAAARQYSSRGNYCCNGTPVTGAGSVGFLALDPALLPDATDPWVFLQHWVEGPGTRPLSAAELAAIEAFEAGNPPETHDVDREILDGGMEELLEDLLPFVEGTALNIGPGYSPYRLVDEPSAE